MTDQSHARPAYVVDGEAFSLAEAAVQSTASFRELLQRQFSFVRMFERMAQQPSRDCLIRLGQSMTVDDNSDPASESQIPAGYSYLGQFLAHELTHMGNIDNLPDGKLPDQRASPGLGLDSLYDGVEFVTEQVNGRPVPHRIGLSKTKREWFCGPLNLEVDRDLGRDMNGKATIPDARNDSNLAIAQLHVALTRFHNAVAELSFLQNPDCRLEHVKKTVIEHFQSVVLDDYLRRIVSPEVYSDVRENGARLWKAPADETGPTSIPIEFAAAAFRFGHSMVRQNYAGWSSVTGVGLYRALTLTHSGGGVVGSLESRWLADWTRFFDFSQPAHDWSWLSRMLRSVRGISHGSHSSLMFARPIDTRLALDMSSLPPFIFEFDGPFKNLAVRTLVLGGLMEFPSGQSAVREANTRLGKSGALPIREVSDIDIPDRLNGTGPFDDLRQNTPLWFYILNEARIQQGGNRLGDLGSRIIMEVIYEILLNSTPTIASDSEWRPVLKRRNETYFTMPDLLEIAGDPDPYKDVPKCPL